MKKAIVISVRESTDIKTGEELCWVTLAKLPSKMKKGGLWYPKKDEQLINACFGAERNSIGYETNKLLKAGTLCDVVFGLNEFTNKTFVANLIVVKDSPYSDSELYDYD